MSEIWRGGEVPDLDAGIETAAREAGNVALRVTQMTRGLDTLEKTVSELTERLEVVLRPEDVNRARDPEGTKVDGNESQLAAQIGEWAARCERVANRVAMLTQSVDL